MFFARRRFDKYDGLETLFDAYFKAVPDCTERRKMRSGGSLVRDARLFFSIPKTEPKPFLHVPWRKAQKLYNDGTPAHNSQTIYLLRCRDYTQNGTKRK